MKRDRAETPVRCMAVDAVKLLAAAAVVWIHVSNCDESRQYLPLCRFAVPFFTCAAVYFVLHKALTWRHGSFTRYCAERAQRLYVPFLLWALFYLGVRAAKHVAMGEGSPIVLTPAVFLNGTAHHLWFLPFICFVSIAVFALGRIMTKLPPHYWMPLGFVLLLLGIAVALLPDPVDIRAEEAPITYFADHALDTLPSVFVGLATFCLARNARPGPAFRLAVLALAMACMIWEFQKGGHPVAPHVAGAALLFFATTQSNRSWMEPVRNWANLAFVIYLIHVLFVEALQVLQNRFGGVASLSADLSVWALALVASALTAKLLLRARPLRWAFPQ